MLLGILFLQAVTTPSAVSEPAAVSAPIDRVAPAPSPRATLDPGLVERMGDPIWIGQHPLRPVWSVDSRTIWFERPVEGRGVSEVWRVPRRGGAPEPVALEDQHQRPPTWRRFDATGSRVLFERSGDLFLQELPDGDPRPLSLTSERERLIGFSADGTAVHFERGGALLARDLATGFEREWARFEFGDDPIPKRDAEPEGFATESQERLIDVVRERRERSKARNENNDRLRALNPFALPERVYLDKSLERTAIYPSPDERFVLIVAAKPPGKADRDSMPDWITESGRVEPRDVRSWVGEQPQRAERLFLLDVAKGEARELDLAELVDWKLDPLSDLRAAQHERETGSDPDSEEDRDEPRFERAARVVQASWTASGSRLAVQIRSSDNKDRWLAEVDLEDAKLQTVDHRHDQAWVGWLDRDFAWLKDESGLWFLSERTGFCHLYLVDGPGSRRRPLTAGRFEVTSVEESLTGGRLFFRTNRDDPGAHELETYDLASGEVQRWTDLGGRLEFSVSPDGSAARILSSQWNQPPDLWLLEFEPGAQPRRLTDSSSAEFRAIEWTEPTWVDVPIATRGSLPRGFDTIRGRAYLPRDDAPIANGDGRPCVLFVHGAGYLQNAHRGWSNYFREFFFHDWLTRRGVVVLDLDYRGSAGYGRDWRTAIYRQMGDPELEDLLAGIDFAAEHLGVDPARVGVYGGSYGGFLTLMGLFKAPGKFAAGAALRPVTDWAHYNHGYTSNILNTPQLDPEAFLRSSPIEFAEGLEDPLLICHGLVDDNVFAKDSIRLAQRLIELGKEHWELALYPAEAHGFREPSSWADEYRRIGELFERHLELAPLPQ